MIHTIILEYRIEYRWDNVFCAYWIDTLEKIEEKRKAKSAYGISLWLNVYISTVANILSVTVYRHATPARVTELLSIVIFSRRFITE